MRLQARGTLPRLHQIGCQLIAGEVPERQWGGLLSRGCGQPHGGSIPSLSA